MNLNDIVIISGCRTAMGKFGGTLKNVPSYDLGAHVVKESIKRAGLTGEQIDDVILGTCRQAGNGPNPARTAAVNGGVKQSTPAISLNMACPSGMRSVVMASQSILLGESEIVITGGFENMSSIPYLLKNARWDGFKMGNKVLEDGWSDSIDPLINQGMGETAENLFDKYKISKEEQDLFAVNSHMKAADAQKNGWFDEEIAPIEISASKKSSSIIFDKDETIRYNANLEDMAKLKPAFRKNGVVTAGNSCGLSDGAVSMIVTSRQKAIELNAKPLFSILSYSSIASDPSMMGEGPGFAIPIALQRANLSLNDIDVIEINEAFAIQVLTNVQTLSINLEKLNIHGGAIALGHPTGISGARIILTAYYALKRLNKTYALCSICGAGGVSMAMVIKREN
ncbi:MAG: acetyl-CoA acetyltransferase [Ignavibacteria bacterium GWF2_33_9]|nr:MAG: acetyl-CoA acetyltransferase [Ignavibacteria bacterium GWF2_33_9]